MVKSWMQHGWNFPPDWSSGNPVPLHLPAIIYNETKRSAQFYLAGKRRIMHIGLAVYGTPFSMGLHAASKRSTIRPQQLMDQALTADLKGVELPISLLDGEDIDAIARYAVDRQLFITLETVGYDPTRLRETISFAERLGVRTIRTLAG